MTDLPKASLRSQRKGGADGRAVAEKESTALRALEELGSLELGSPVLRAALSPKKMGGSLRGNGLGLAVQCPETGRVGLIQRQG